MEITFAEMFCGAGGFRLGLEKASEERINSQQRIGNKERQPKPCLEGSNGRELKEFRCVWANDWEYADFKWIPNKETGKLEWKGTKNKCGEIYRKHWNDGTYIDQDINTIKVDSIPNHTLLTAGFPCQAFSVAGKRKGFKDTRGTLFHSIVRVAEAKRPPLLLLENVKGLLSHDEGLTFQIIIESLEELGYLVEWQMLNSKYFGVPQNRERVFIVGHLRGRGGRQIFPIGANGEVSPRQREGEPESGEEASTLEASYGKSKSMNNMVAGALSGGAHSGGLHSQMTVVAHSVRSGGRGSLDRHAWDTVMLHNVYGGFNEKEPRIFKDVSPTIRTPKGGGHLPLVASTVDCDGYLRFGERPRDEQGKPQLLPIGYRRIRRLTPIECERLQGFPDDWTKGVSDTQRYKLLGNAVTVNVIEFLGFKLSEGCVDGKGDTE